MRLRKGLKLSSKTFLYLFYYIFLLDKENISFGKINQEIWKSKSFLTNLNGSLVSNISRGLKRITFTFLSSLLMHFNCVCV